MEKTKRFGVSMENKLLKKFDSFIKRKNYPNRSEAIRDLIRLALVDEEWKETDHDVIGVLVIVYDHDRRELTSSMLDREHKHTDKILTTLHIHLDHENCLEAKIIKGKMKEVQKIADELISLKGVKFGKLIPATFGKGI
ncbi:MAG: nickel-responsive transcriptional regulator NikR [Candidatus Latescibacteria bacterium 4484_7]|nr:MAG: nickel-responsive transcriptional regulator NikR [Candidatus Latescibacteria bacterium 4484_7]